MRKFLKKMGLNIVHWFIKPRMIKGYRDSYGKYLPNVRMSTTVYINEPSKLFLEDYVFIWHYTILDSSNKITICEGCQIGAWVGIFTHSSHISIRLYGRNYLKTKNPIGYIRGEVFIGSYTFIGPHSIILPGSKIGKGCLILPYTVIQGEVPDFSIIEGNPGKVRGDVRKIDERYLKNHPELIEEYNRWTHT